jgi:hypothetical protein
MKKIETIYHYLLYQAIEKTQFQHTQAGLAELFRFSTSTINLALAKPTAIGAVRKSGKFFVVADPLKLLYLAATFRNLAKDIIYHTTSTLTIHELEGLAPPATIFGGYSAASQILVEPPADYSSLYLYTDSSDLHTIKSRYPSTTAGSTQVVILQKPTHIQATAHTSLPPTFIDIWNMSDWYAHDFITALEDKIRGLLS